MVTNPIALPKFSHSKQRINKNVKKRTVDTGCGKLLWVAFCAADTSGVSSRKARVVGKSLFRPYGTYGKFTMPRWLCSAIEQHLRLVYASRARLLMHGVRCTDTEN